MYRRLWMSKITGHEYSGIRSVHFVSGGKSNNPLSLDYVPSLFEQMKSPLKRKHVHDIIDIILNNIYDDMTQCAHNTGPSFLAAVQDLKGVLEIR